MYKKLLVNDGDFMKELKLHWTISNFATYYNPKQPWFICYMATIFNYKQNKG